MGGFLCSDLWVAQGLHLATGSMQSLSDVAGASCATAASVIGCVCVCERKKASMSVFHCYRCEALLMHMRRLCRQRSGLAVEKMMGLQPTTTSLTVS